jgi:hypothetical protein
VYSFSFGFTVLREVDENIADRVLWGATGSLMKMNLDNFFTEWTPKLKKMKMLAEMSQRSQADER